MKFEPSKDLWKHQVLFAVYAGTKGPGQLPCQWNPNGIEEMRAVFSSEC